MDINNKKKLDDNYKKYRLVDNELIDKFNSMPFYHQIGSGDNDLQNVYFSYLINILNEKQLYSLNKLNENGLNAQGYSLEFDKKIRNRDQYIFLTLGTVVSPKSKKQITIEIPQNLIRSNKHGFFANDLTHFGSFYGNFTEQDIKKWESSIVTAENGITITVSYVETQFEDLKNYIEGNIVKSYNDMRKDVFEKKIYFTPEFMIKDELCVQDKNIVFHLTGYTEAQAGTIQSLMDDNGYDSETQLKIHSTTKDFIEYLRGKAVL